MLAQPHCDVRRYWWDDALLAVASGLTDQVWTINDVVALMGPAAARIE